MNAEQWIEDAVQQYVENEDVDTNRRWVNADELLPGVKKAPNIDMYIGSYLEWTIDNQGMHNKLRMLSELTVIATPPNFDEIEIEGQLGWGGLITKLMVEAAEVEVKRRIPDFDKIEAERQIRYGKVEK